MLRTLDQLEIGPRRRTLVLNRFQSYAGSLSPGEVARQLDEPVAAVIRQDRRVVEAANLGTPIVERRSLWGSSKSFVRLANILLQQLNADKQVDRAVRSNERIVDPVEDAFLKGVATNVS
jgi:pilus assembly protein CpaE